MELKHLRLAFLQLGLAVLLVTPAAHAQQVPAKPPSLSPSEALPSLAPLVESVKAAVVNVDVQARAPTSSMGGNPFEDLFGGPRMGTPDQELLRRGEGSGFIVDASGLVLTNNHVVADAVNIKVRLSDGRSFSAKVLGRDPLTDVALLRLEGKVSKLPVVKLGDSDQLREGDWVLAIGNPFGLASSVSLGIVSGRGRDIQAGPYDNFIQTDAAINPGNSGGPLFNLKGEVIGINTAIVGGGASIGFAVPSNMARALLPQLEKGKVVRGWLGVGIQDLTPELATALKAPSEEGVVINSLEGDTPAAKAGLKVEDVVVSLDGTKVTSATELSRRVALKAPGEKVKLGISRQGKKMDLTVTLGTRPDIEGLARGEGSGAKESESQARLGMTLQDQDPRVARTQQMSERGALITQVVPGAPAEAAGLQRGMLVVEADRKPVRSAAELQQYFSKLKSGQTVLLKVEIARGGTLLRAIRIP